MGRSETFLKSRRFPFRRTWLLLPIDIFGLVISLILSFGLRFNWHIPNFYQSSLVWFVCIMPLLLLPMFLLFRMYSRVWRYASVEDMRAIIVAVGYFAIAVKLVDLFLPNVNLPLSIWLSTNLLTLVFVSGSRFLVRLLYGSTRALKSRVASPGKSRVLIYGAGAAGAIVSREADRDPNSSWEIIGFVDDDKHKQGLMLNRKRILGTKWDIPRLITQHGVEKILIAMPSLSRTELRELVDKLNVHKRPILIIPPFSRWAVNNLFAQVRPVDVEDLLGRDPLPVDVQGVGGYLKNSVVLVTGAGGSIGSEICRQVAMMEPKLLVLVGRGENSIFEIDRELRGRYPTLQTQFVIGDIRDKTKMSRVFKAYKPHVVFHAAAHKHVPLMEEHPDEALKNNILGTRSLAQLACDFGAEKFVLISSDKAVRPTNVMGATKRIAEMVIQDIAQRSTKTSFVTVRFGNVLGSRGSVVRVFREQIAQGGPVTVTDQRMVRYFMTIPEAVRLVIEAGAIGENGRVYLLDMGEPVKIMDLAERMIRLSGFVPGVDIPIKVTGIRPGEKLFEELSRESDSVSIDAGDRIWSVQCPVMAPLALESSLNDLVWLYEQGDTNSLAQAIKELAWWEPDVVGNPAAMAEVAATSPSGIVSSTRPSLQS